MAITQSEFKPTFGIVQAMADERLAVRYPVVAGTVDASSNITGETAAVVAFVKFPALSVAGTYWRMSGFMTLMGATNTVTLTVNNQIAATAPTTVGTSVASVALASVSADLYSTVFDVWGHVPVLGAAVTMTCSGYIMSYLSGNTATYAQTFVGSGVINTTVDCWMQFVVDWTTGGTIASLSSAIFEVVTPTQVIVTP